MTAAVLVVAKAAQKIRALLFRIILHTVQCPGMSRQQVVHRISGALQVPDPSGGLVIVIVFALPPLPAARAHSS